MSQELPTTRRLNGRYVIHGPLGVPLGEVIAITAQPIHRPGKGENEYLRVVGVGDKPLERPIDMPYSLYRFSDLESLDKAKTYRLRVFQDGGFDGIPAQVMKETVSVQSRGYTFYTRLLVVRSLGTLGVSKQQSR